MGYNSDFTYNTHTAALIGLTYGTSCKISYLTWTKLVKSFHTNYPGRNGIYSSLPMWWLVRIVGSFSLRSILHYALWNQNQYRLSPISALNKKSQNLHLPNVPLLSLYVQLSTAMCLQKATDQRNLAIDKSVCGMYATKIYCVYFDILILSCKNTVQIFVITQLDQARRQVQRFTKNCH